MLKKVRYSEPIYSGDELNSIEIINGAFLSDYDIDDIIRNDRYGKGDLRLENPLDIYKISGNKVHYNVNSVNTQLCYMPEYKEIKDTTLIPLTFTPPINELEFLGSYNFYYGDKQGDKELPNFPFGFIISGDEFAISGWSGYGIAMGCNGEKRLVNLGIKDNIFTWKYSDYHKEKSADSFNVVCLDANLNHVATLSFNKAPYPLYKMSFFNSYCYLINYDLIGSKLAFIRNGKVLYDYNFIKGQYLKFIRTYKFDLVYNQKEFWLFNKLNEKVIYAKFNMEFDDIFFNPILKSICIHKKGKFSIYRFFGEKAVEVAKNSELLEFMLPYVVEWNGNLKYDYMIKSELKNPQIDKYIVESEHRGHYLKTLGEYSSDYEIGKFTKSIKLSYGNKDDFHINDFDDGDLGVKEHLPFRRTQIKTHEKINLNQMAYTRAYKGGIRRIIFYSLDFDNEFGRLLVYKF